jgi:hypothetical protein
MGFWLSSVQPLVLPRPALPHVALADMVKVTPLVKKPQIKKRTATFFRMHSNRFMRVPVSCWGVCPVRVSCGLTCVSSDGLAAHSLLLIQDAVHPCLVPMHACMLEPCMGRGG